MNLEDIMLKEVSQPQEDEFYMNPLKKVIYNSQIHRNKEYNEGCQACKEG